jgi:predicted nucleic acid-binding protein
VIVVDTNLLVYLYVPSTRTAQAEAVFQRDPLWVTAYLWRSEFRNTLVGLIRQGNLSIETAQHMAERAESFMAGREYTVVTDHVLQLAAESGCLAYDCEVEIMRSFFTVIAPTFRPKQWAFFRTATAMPM